MVMSLPCVEVGVPIESLVKVIRLNGPGFNPVNVTRMSRNGAEQKGQARRRISCHPESLWELACQRWGRHIHPLD
ncbi:hypothetical protein RS3R6_37030 [Pseudomonas atacamensis]|uniref:Uncharacterized protein n=1 Tax=Pseudomonas atacamensis TaxID=2565368 RepID=A0ABQ5PHV6_9PSED|nr:hypothetical protein RS3R1_20630 [Pseudomonas atacamensis]GLH55521.1 hypothetical protein RS3R6_37030 [Pseudomonas atacamensis]